MVVEKIRKKTMFFPLKMTYISHSGEIKQIVMSSCSCHSGADIAKNRIQNDGLGDEIFADSGGLLR